MASRGLTAAGLVGVAVALAGCAGAVSTSSFKGEAHAVAERISSFQKQAAEGNQKKVCEEDLASTLRQDIGKAGRSCEEAVREQLKAVEEIALTVKSVTVAGAAATARVESTYWGSQCANDLYLVREGKAWRISGVGSGCPPTATKTTSTAAKPAPSSTRTAVQSTTDSRRSGSAATTSR